MQWFFYAYPELRGCLWATANGLHVAGSPRVRAMKWNAFAKAGGRKGTPDLMLMVASSGKHGLFIEMKRQNATASAIAREQHDFADQAMLQGYRAEICRGAVEAKKLIADYLQPLEPRIAL
ncbi:MAG: VRR-NUC domain-containing protein [Pseudomonadota bacterium]